jgi:hypothetical protein
MSSKNNRGQGDRLRTPKSVNDTMNTKVQRCWVTPSQPNEAYVDVGEDEKAKVKVGNKKETVGEERKRWERNGGKETVGRKHFNLNTARACCEKNYTHDFDPHQTTSCRPSLIVVLTFLTFFKTLGLG